MGWWGGGSAREGARCGRRRIAASNLISLLDVEIDGAAVRNLQPLRGRRKNQTRERDGGCWRNLIGSVSQSVGLHPELRMRPAAETTTMSNQTASLLVRAEPRRRDRSVAAAASESSSILLG